MGSPSLMHLFTLGVVAHANSTVRQPGMGYATLPAWVSPSQLLLNKGQKKGLGNKQQKKIEQKF